MYKLLCVVTLCVCVHVYVIIQKNLKISVSPNRLIYLNENNRLNVSISMYEQVLLPACITAYVVMHAKKTISCGAR